MEYLHLEYINPVRDLWYAHCLCADPVFFHQLSGRLCFIHIIELRLFNLVILMAGVYFALRQYQRTHGGRMDYFHSFTNGYLGHWHADLPVFLLAYLFIDRELMQTLAERQSPGFCLDPYFASFMVSLEGVFSGLFVNFLL